MAKQTGGSTKTTALHQRAEARLKITRSDIAAMPIEDVQQLVHELQVHQIKLEMQNEESRRIQAELEASRAALRESHALLRQVIDLNPHFIFAKDREGRFTLVNKAVAECYGTTPEGLIGKTDADFNCDLEQVEHFRRMDMQVMESQQELVIEDERITDAQGNHRRLHTIKRAILDERGQVTHVLGVSIDMTKVKQTEEAFRQSSQILTNIVENIPWGVFMKDPQNEFRITLWNKGAEEMYGISRAEMIGKTAHDFWPREQAELFLAADRLATREQALQDLIEVPSYSRSRGNMIVRARKLPLSDLQGRVSQLLVLSEDVTQQKQAADEAHERARQVRLVQAAFLELAGLDYAKMPFSSAVQRVTETVANTFGMDRVSVWLFPGNETELVCQDLYELRTAAHLSGDTLLSSKYPRYMTALKDSLVINTAAPCDDPRTSEFTQDYLIPLGITSLMDVPIRRHGRLIGVVCHEQIGLRREWGQEILNFAKSEGETIALILEVAERKRVEQELQELTLAQAFAMPGISKIGSDGRYLFVNDHYADKLGYRASELMGECWETTVHPDDLPLVRQAYADMTATGKGECELRGLKKDGTIFHKHIVLVRIDDGVDQKKVSNYCLMRDITERKNLEKQRAIHAGELERQVIQRTAEIAKLESQRAQTEKMAALGQLAAGVAHEINNPIAGIRNAFLVVKQAIPLDYVHYNFVGMIEREIDRVATIVRQLYQLHRPEHSQAMTFDLAELLVDLKGLVQSRVNQQNIVLIIVPLSSPIRLMGYQGDLLQVLLNLVQNAIDASADHGCVRIESLVAKEGVSISVTDDGAGISSETLPRIFEPFFTTKNTGADKSMGLGLAVSHGIVHTMGGRIEVQSQLGVGTTVTVLLPSQVVCALQPALSHSGGVPS